MPIASWRPRGDAGGDVAGFQCAVRFHPFLVEDVDAGKIVQEKRVGAVRDDIDSGVVDFSALMTVAMLPRARAPGSSRRVRRRQRHRP